MLGLVCSVGCRLLRGGVGVGVGGRGLGGLLLGLLAGGLLGGEALLALGKGLGAPRARDLLALRDVDVGVLVELLGALAVGLLGVVAQRLGGGVDDVGLYDLRETLLGALELAQGTTQRAAHARKLVRPKHQEREQDDKYELSLLLCQTQK